MLLLNTLVVAAKKLGAQGFLEGAALPPQVDPDLLERARYLGINHKELTDAYAEGWFEEARKRETGMK